MMLALTYGAAPSIAVAQPQHLQQELYALHGRSADAASRG